jgi:hypothetical protein
MTKVGRSSAIELAGLFIFSPFFRCGAEAPRQQGIEETVFDAFLRDA